ncbi:MAG: NAD(P)-dependent oxidoreductase [Planctomycetaceae bacterium]|nr:NAD(P)-dependent oxidoreductase [Planctomycetaceae bacterium]
MSKTVRVPERVLLTGATGYVGGRLAPRLLEQGYEVVCLVREPRKLAERPWRDDPRVTIVADDLSDPAATAEKIRGCRHAYYLIHSMGGRGDDYRAKDRRLAEDFAQAAAAADIQRIVYLGGLGEMGDGLSEHLTSRREVEHALRATGVPVTALRAAMIIGSGSASFEILRYLVERLPVMITPKWVKTECQPVAIADVLHWLVTCLATPETTGRTLEIGGPDVLTYRELMQVAAEELQLNRRVIMPVPVLTPRLSSAWISLVTPVDFRLARALAEGLKNRVVVTNDATQKLMPRDALGVRESIRRAIARTHGGQVETRWSAAGPIPGDPDWAGGRVFTDRRTCDIDAPAADVFAAVCRVGGGHGWYAADVLWRIRGWMDQAVGGPGLRRGRRHPELVEFGEALDFWRVVGLQRNKSLRLRAEMKLPGVARLEFELEPAPAETQAQTRLTMTARFAPRGLAGIAYWYAVLPFHAVVFNGMLKGIRRAAESGEMTESTETRPAAAPPASDHALASHS